MGKLVEAGYLRNSKNGFINRKGYHVGYVRLHNGKRVVEDWYADKAKTL